MPGKINVYDLGSKGVNVVKSAVHLEDGEVTQAQNFTSDPVSSFGGVRKRDGMSKLTTGALAGAARGIIGLPLPDRSALTRFFYSPYDEHGGASGNFWFRSSDGTTWTALTTAAQPQQLSDLGGFGTAFGPGALTWCAHRDKIYYPGHDYSSGLPSIHVFDGTTDFKLVNIPRNSRDSTDPTGILSIVPYSTTELIVSTYDSNSGTGRGRVMLLDITNGQITVLGPETDLNGGIVLRPIVYQNKIWIGTHNRSGGASSTVRWIRPGDVTWTTDFTSGATKGYIYGFAIFKELLYAGFGSDVGGNGQIQARSAAGTWSVVHTSDGTGASNFCGPLITNRAGDKIYSFRNSVSGGANPINRILESTDGASWTLSLDLGNLATHSAPGYPILDDNGDIYWMFFDPAGSGSGDIYRNVSGTWSGSLKTDSHLRGPISKIKV